jgi:Fe-S oxidoreductase
MISKIAMSLMLIAAFGFFFYTMYEKIRLLLKGKPENRFDKIGMRIDRMLIYAFFQKKLFKDFLPGLSHALIFWGFLILLIRSTLLIISAYGPEPVLPGIIGDYYTFLKDLTEVVVVVCVVYSISRRIFFPIKRVTPSMDAYAILGMILILMITDFIGDGAKFAHAAGMNDPANPVLREMAFAPVGAVFAKWFAGTSPSSLVLIEEIMYWIHMSVLLFFLNYLPYSKHFHVILSIPNTFLGKLTHPGALRPIENIENQETLGVSKLEEFTWKQIMDSFSCTECGRCTMTCPTVLTDKPLSPKELILGIREHLHRKAPFLLGKKTDGQDFNLIQDLKPDAVWSCTTCRSCEENCPLLITHTDKIIDIRRYLTMMESSFPKELNLTLKNLENKSNPWGLAMGDRAKWMESEEKVPHIKDSPDADYLFFIGCFGCYDDRNKKVTASLVKLMKAAGVRIATLGTDEGCCGDPARRLGNEYLAQMQMQSNIEQFNSFNVRKIMTACPHCFNSLKHEYPQFKGSYEVFHHTQVLDMLIAEGRLKVKKGLSRKVAFHDSCYLGRYNSIYEQPRRLLNAVSSNGNIVEFEKSRENGMCCGAGGSRVFMEEHLGTRINQLRIDQALEKNPDIISVACPFCMMMIKDGIAEKQADNRLQVREISELLLENL